ncbi:sensor domain-containing protein [Nonomuraea jabiensis]|uniref:sensor domain-containing protein n=1 Tax=Nonomuraea jabiensis TaxID=882448 RepID=UPI003D74C1C7
MTSLQRRLATDTRYTLLGLPLSLASFGVTVVGVSAGLGGAVAFVGLPVLAATAAASRHLADLERVALPDVLGHPVARPPYTPVPEGAGWFRRMMNPLASGQAMMDLLHGIIAFPFALVSFVLTATWWLGAVAGLTFPIYGWAVDRIPGVGDGLPEWLAFYGDPTAFVIVNTVAGALFALTLVPVARIAALLKGGIAQTMLTRAAYPESAAAQERAWIAGR